MGLLRECALGGRLRKRVRLHDSKLRCRVMQSRHTTHLSLLLYVYRCRFVRRRAVPPHRARFGVRVLRVDVDTRS